MPTYMDQPQDYPKFSMPLRGLLLLAGVYTAIWGAFFRYFGEAVLAWLFMQKGFVLDAGTVFYGILGIISGISLFLSAFYPLSWIYLMGFGILIKLFSGLWFIFTYLGALGWNKRVAFHLFFNELLWLVPLTIILFQAWKVSQYLRQQDNTKK